jgi:TATA-box binding protein (TBP) (component of TFIID and TFIIIB)
MIESGRGLDFVGLRLIPRLKIANVVATADLKQSVDLERLASADGFLYDQAIYPCAYLRDEKTRVKVSIFATGKMTCAGACEV